MEDTTIFDQFFDHTFSQKVFFDHTFSQKVFFDKLDNHPEFIPVLRQLYWNEWEDSLKKEFNINDFSEYQLAPEITYFIGILHDNQTKKLICSIAITPNDLGEKTTLTPWLSYVYVVKEYRKKGVANKMIMWYLEHVSIRPLYLWCKHPLEHFYNNFGFKIIENRSDIAIMKLDA